jgi:hypothetical protein
MNRLYPCRESNDPENKDIVYRPLILTEQKASPVLPFFGCIDSCAIRETGLKKLTVQFTKILTLVKQNQVRQKNYRENNGISKSFKYERYIGPEC